MKKFLSLVLALIMTMSLVTISAGATEYRDLTDKDEIQYEEAVAVLNRIGVITGYEDGSFRPEGELTRGAAAKIIVSLLIGPEAAANLPNATAPYPDVPASHTFAGVISYCKTAKIISGYGDGTFKPGNSLTGFAFAKMLLGALGYKQEIEGFVDTGWTMNVAKVGNVTGLFDRLDFDGAAAVNRETACQLALNTLKATMVTYGGTTLVTGAQALAVQGTQAMYVTSNNREINANINRRVINAVNNEMTLEFGEEHFKDLRLEHDKYDPAYDIYGHPSNEWSYKKVTIGTFKLPADFTYTKQMAHIEDSVATKEKALGLRNYDTYSLDHRNFTANWSTASSRNDWNSPFADATQVTINGWNARAYNKAYVNATTDSLDNGTLYTYDADSLNTLGSVIDATKKAQAPSIAEICDLTDNGVTVEVYVCPVDADFITNVVVMRTQLMKVKTIGSDFVRLEDIEPDSHDHYKTEDKQDSGLGRIAGYNAFAIDCTCKKWSDRPINDVKDDNYDAYNALKDMKAGDYVAVVPYTADDGKTWEVGEAYAPETVSGRLTRVDIYNSEKRRQGNAVAITVGGTSYPINEWNLDMRDITDNIIKSTRKDVTVYLAKDGTALWATKVGNTDAWMIVGDYYQGTNDAGKIVWYVHGWTLGGDEVDLDLGTIRGAAEKYAPGELVRYEINTASGGGEYVLGKPNNNGSSVKKSGMYQDGWGKFKNPQDPFTGEFTDHQIKEYPRASGDDWKKNWEGIYRVALAYGNQGEAKGNIPYQYTIDKGLDYIALDYYGENPTVENKSSAIDNVKPTTGYQWKVSTRYYDTNPTFIYVSFDSTGEVETIDFVKGRQEVRNEDLRDYNTAWRNVGTNSDNFVATTAEAYVNDESKVEAVVIKTDSSDANLSSMRIITKSSGSNNHDKGAEEATSFTGKWNEREYVQGPDFNMSDAKVGVFDKGYDVGDILVGTEKDGIFYAKEFHGNIYRGNSLDGLWIKGIARVTKDNTPYLEDCFKIMDTSEVKTLDQSKAASLFAEFNDLMVAEDEPDLNDELKPVKEKGLIRCVNAKIVDVRVGHEGEITKLKDLLDTKKYDLTNIELKVLFNGKKTDSSFRNAYAVVILDAPKALSGEIDPKASIDVDGDYSLVDGKYTVPVGKTLNLKALLENASELNSGVTYEWSYTPTTAGVKMTGLKTKEATFKSDVKGTFTVKLVVTNPKVTKDTYGQDTETITIEVTDGKKTGGSVVTNLKDRDGKPVLDINEGSAYVPVSGDLMWFANVDVLADWGVKAGANYTQAEIQSIDYKVKLNGTTIGTYTKASSATTADASNVKIVAAGTTLNISGKDALGLTPEADVSVEITKVTFAKVVVKFESGDTAKIADWVVTGANTSTDLAHGGADLKLALNTKTADADIEAAVKFTTKGLTTDVTTATAVNGFSSGMTTALTNGTRTPAQNGPVVITLTGLGSLTKADPVYTVTDVTTAKALSGALAGKTITLTSSPTGNFKGGETVTVTATLDTAIATTAYPAKVEVTSTAFTEKLTFNFKNDGTTRTGTATFTMPAASVDLNDCTITVAQIAVPKVKSVTLTGGTTAGWQATTDDTITITFDGAVTTATAIAVDASSTFAGTAATINASTATAGTTTTINVATNAPTTGDTLVLKISSITADTTGYVNPKNTLITIPFASLVDNKAVNITDIVEVAP